MTSSTMNQILRLAPSMRPPMEPVVSSANTSSTRGLLTGGTAGSSLAGAVDGLATGGCTMGATCAMRATATTANMCETSLFAHETPPQRHRFPRPTPPPGPESRTLLSCVYGHDEHLARR